MATDEGRALVIAVNKWDLVRDRAAAARAIDDRLERSLAQVRGVPWVALSALTGFGVDGLMPQVFAAHERWARRIATSRLNRWLEEAVARHPPPAAAGRATRIRYITQVKARPPTFALFANHPKAVHETYLRFLANELREAFDLPGVPIRFMLRKGKNPYAGGQ